MKYLIFLFAFAYTVTVNAETVSGQVLQVRDTVAYIKTADGKKIPVIVGDNTFYRKKKVPKKGRRVIDTTETYLPLMMRGDNVTLTYDPDTVDPSTGAVRASDVLITTD